MAGKQKPERGTTNRNQAGTDVSRPSSRVSQAAGTMKAVGMTGTSGTSGTSGSQRIKRGQPVEHFEQRSTASKTKTKSSTRNKGGSKSSGKSGGRSKSSSPSYRSTPAPSNDTRDTQFIQWTQNKWSNLEPHHKQRLWSFLLLALSLLLFGALTVFQHNKLIGGIGKFFFVVFGWSAYLVALGLVIFALAYLIEGLRGERFIRPSLVIGSTILLLLILTESRLILGPRSFTGVLGEIFVRPLLGWPTSAAHIILLGLIVVVCVFTFRITFGHVLQAGYFFRGLLSDERTRFSGNQGSQNAPTGPSPYRGQRPQFSRYGSGQTSGNSVPPPSPEDIEAEQGEQGEQDEDEGVVQFESDFGDENDDPRNDINLHKDQVGLVPRGRHTPAPFDVDEHKNAVRGARQQPLPIPINEQETIALPDKLIVRDTGFMEPLQPNPHRVAQNAPIPNVPRTPQRTPRLVHPMPPPEQGTWKLPDTAMLNNPDEVKMQMLGDDTATLARTIQETLRSFRVDAEVKQEDISIGPTVIRFGIRPTGKPEMKPDEKTGKPVPVRDAAGNIIYETRTRVSRIMALQNDLALVLEAKTIRMEAPVPGRPYVGVEIPNKNSRLVTLREVLESKEYQSAKAKSKLTVALGKDVAGAVRVGDLAKMPHVLIAGATGAGKCLAYDEPVFLANGEVVKVQELVGQTIDVVGITDTQTMQQVPVSATFAENGLREVFEIELDNGIILRRTGEHPLWAAQLDENQHVGRQPDGKAARRTRAIGSGWVHAKDLRVCGNRPDFDGHVILCPLTLSQQGTLSKSDADVILCAALLAEGGLSHDAQLTYMKTPRFTNADPAMVELVAKAAKEYNCELVVSPHKTKGFIDYYISQPTRKGRGSGNPVARLVYDWKIDCLATQKQIPDWVFQLPDEQIALFLRVFIDCDGWITVRGHRSSVSTTLANPILIKQIGQLALRLGFTGTYTYKENGFAGAWTWTTTMVEEWQERVGSLVKAEKLALAVADQAKSREDAATVWNAWRRARPLASQKFSDCPAGYEWRKIVAIRHIECPTVNIEVHSDNHAFVGYAIEHNSVMINSMIASIATQATPDDVRMLMVDPKMVELSMYNGIPHLLSPVVTEVEKVVSLLKNGITEMERRYRLFSQLGVRNLDGYRKMRAEKMARGDMSLQNLPAIVIIIDELADLMMAAPEEVEGMICRLAQLARATGIHLVVATQRPSVDVITGLIKANIPTRISFMVSSAVDSRTIIDMGGAERLLGRGDMLYLPADAGRPERVQGCFLTDEEAEHLVQFWRQQAAERAIANNPNTDATTLQSVVEPGWELREQEGDDDELDDDLLDKAEEVVREYGKASISLLQRRLKIGYSRAARLIDLLEEQGIIGPSESGGRGREILDGGNGNGGGFGESHTMADEVEDIMAEEKARNDFLKKQAEQGKIPPDDVS